MSLLGKSKVLAVLIVAVAGIAFLALSWQEHARKEEIRTLKNELSDFVVPRTSEEDELGALRAQHYGVETRLDPLFGASGMNIETFEGVLNLLKTEQQDVFGFF